MLLLINEGSLMAAKILAASCSTTTGMQRRRHATRAASYEAHVVCNGRPEASQEYITKRELAGDSLAGKVWPGMHASAHCWQPGVERKLPGTPSQTQPQRPQTMYDTFDLI